MCILQTGVVKVHIKVRENWHIYLSYLSNTSYTQIYVYAQFPLTTFMVLKRVLNLGP